MIAFIAALCLAVAAVCTPLDPTMTWQRTDRLRDPGKGQPYFDYATAVHTLGSYVAAGSTTAASARGECRVLRDDGAGHTLVATLTDAKGTHGDGFGDRVLLFEFNSALHVAVSSPNKDTHGEVLVFKHDGSGGFPLQEELRPPNLNGRYATHFGRTLTFDGKALLIGAEARYQHSLRYEVAAINIKGSRHFIETSGSESLNGGDPIFAFSAKPGRDNTTRIAHSQTIQAAPDHLDFGSSVAVENETMIVGASLRDPSRYGHGNDGDLVVTGNEILDGAAVYNFDNIVILPGGTLTVDYYDSLRKAGGVLNIKVRQQLLVHPGGAVNLTARGHKGAPAKYSNSRHEDGEYSGGGKTATSTFVDDNSCSYDGAAAASLTTGVGGSGTTINASSNLTFAEANGGGGGYGSVGEDGVAVQCGESGVGGAAYGTPELTEVERGSGGGAGFPWKVGNGGQGGDGGGAMVIFARVFINNGTIESAGGPGGNGGFFSGGGGGGSGGGIYLGGETFENNGVIHARGGLGGFRSQNSGSEPDPGVQGGAGGVGRIRLEFLTIVANGTIDPAPYSRPKYEGAVYIFDRTPDATEWVLRSEVPRTEAMRFIGHGVALSTSLGAVSTTDRHETDPVERVVLFHLADVTAVSTPLPIGRVRDIDSPAPAPAVFNFGAALTFTGGGEVLVIQAPGKVGVAPGRVVLHTAADLMLTPTTSIVNLQQANSTAGDLYGTAASAAYPVVFIPATTQDDGFSDPAGRLSRGNLQLWRHRRNVDPAQSVVECDETRATLLTVVRCRVLLKDATGAALGDRSDHPLIVAPSPVTLTDTGRFEFDFTCGTAGSIPIPVTYGGVALTGGTWSIEVTPGLGTDTAISCTPLQLAAGQTVTCTLTVPLPAGRGESNAAPLFRATVYNTFDAFLDMRPAVVGTPFGRYAPPRSVLLKEDPEKGVFETQNPAVAFVSTGVYRFTFKPWRPGRYAVLTTYRNAVLDGNAPILVNATDPTIDAPSSGVVCPTMAPPNRTVECILTLRGAGGVLSGLARDDRHDLEYPVAENATVDDGDHGVSVQATLNGTTIPHTLISAREGRVSILAYPEDTGTLNIAATVSGTAVPLSPAAGIDVRHTMPRTCADVSTILMSFQMMRQVGLTALPPMVFFPGEGYCSEPGL